MVLKSFPAFSIPPLQYEGNSVPRLWQESPFIIILEFHHKNIEEYFFAYICHLKVSSETPQGICNAIDNLLVKDAIPADHLIAAGIVATIDHDNKRILLNDGNTLLYHYLIVLFHHEEDLMAQEPQTRQDNIHSWGLKALRQSLKIQDSSSAKILPMFSSVPKVDSIHYYKALDAFGLNTRLPKVDVTYEQESKKTHPLSKYDWYVYR